MEKEYEKDLIIDKYALDSECLDQPRKFMKWSETLADAIAERDRAEQKVEVTKAEVEQNIRRDPDAFGIDKPTEAAIKSTVTASNITQKVIEEWIQAKHRVNILYSAKDALEQRKTMLENLVRLFLSGYWSDPKIKPEAKEEMLTKASEQQREALNRSPKLKHRRGI